MIRLYKGGDESPLLHPIDAQAWRAIGWVDEPTNESVDAPISEDAGLSKDEREAELMDMDWRDLKDIADGFSPPILRQSGLSWEETIPEILEREYGSN